LAGVAGWWDWEGWGDFGGVFWGVVGAGSGVDAGCEPTGTSALPGSALPGVALPGAVSVSVSVSMGRGKECGFSGGLSLLVSFLGFR
ncbi:MAG: hypothetical protein PHF14_10075, partial [Verrucomicrobiota bacterium]|nr:hypothetical protein [Verrucomicrobiota bacterium]